jgi:hypothetical protein
MSRKPRRKWTVELLDGRFFDYTHRRCYTNSIRCSTLNGALKHVNKNLAIGHAVKLERWRLIKQRSPRYTGDIRYHVDTYIYHPKTARLDQ